MDSVKLKNYFENHDHKIGGRGHIELDRPNPAYMVVHVVNSRVGVIRVK